MIIEIITRVFNVNFITGFTELCSLSISKVYVPFSYNRFKQIIYLLFCRYLIVFHMLSFIGLVTQM